MGSHIFSTRKTINFFRKKILLYLFLGLICIFKKMLFYENIIGIAQRENVLSIFVSVQNLNSLVRPGKSY